MKAVIAWWAWTTNGLQAELESRYRAAHAVEGWECFSRSSLERSKRDHPTCSRLAGWSRLLRSRLLRKKHSAALYCVRGSVTRLKLGLTDSGGGDIK